MVKAIESSPYFSTVKLKEVKKIADTGSRQPESGVYIDVSCGVGII
jgi:hypothetical protein